MFDKAKIQFCYLRGEKSVEASFESDYSNEDFKAFVRFSKNENREELKLSINPAAE